jgi:catechol 2,3-dioxygenase-like lactoylglutathione lyase family enzyme
MNIAHLDHLVLTVSNIDTTVDFYQRVLGMRMQTFADGRVALHFGRPGLEQKINLHAAGEEFEPKAHRPTPGSADLCLVTELSLAEAMAKVRACGVEIIEGPVARTGAAGSMTSFYFRDPDLNLIEICRY